MSTRESCSICLEIITETNVVITKCNHKFHLTCILNHSERSENKSCPVCRRLLKEEEEEAPTVAESEERLLGARDTGEDRESREDGGLREVYTRTYPLIRPNINISELPILSESHSEMRLIEVIEETENDHTVWRGPRDSIDLEHLIFNNINNLPSNSRYTRNLINNNLNLNEIITNSPRTRV